MQALYYEVDSLQVRKRMAQMFAPLQHTQCIHPKASVDSDCLDQSATVGHQRRDGSGHPRSNTAWGDSRYV
jgi:hypothetical protein